MQFTSPGRPIYKRQTDNINDNDQYMYVPPPPPPPFARCARTLPEILRFLRGG